MTQVYLADYGFTSKLFHLFIRLSLLKRHWASFVDFSNIRLFFVLLYFVCLWVCRGPRMHVEVRGQLAAVISHWSVWIPGIQLKWLGPVASAFTCGASHQPHCWYLSFIFYEKIHHLLFSVLYDLIHCLSTLGLLTV